jgi:hypothetical protein
MADAQFVTSAYKEHTVIGTIGVINGIVGGVLPPFVAKVCDSPLLDTCA